jgi:hypothetical protein
MKEEIQNVRKYKAIERLANSDGGKHLIKDAKDGAVSILYQLSINYATLSHTEFIALSAGLAEKMSMIEKLTGARKEKESAIAILEALEKEADED